MSGRRLSAEEAALWRQVMATVRPIRPPTEQVMRAAPPPAPDPKRGAALASLPALPPPRAAATVPNRPGPGPGTTLDASWDRKLASGAIAPDVTIDLHGHTLDTAYRVLDAALDRAIARRDRLLLLITGRAPRAESERPHVRGRIRAAVGDWLAASRHAAQIAAVRGAHPRHGGAGALYIILRRPR